MSYTFSSSVTRLKDESGTRVFHAVESRLEDDLRKLLQAAELQGFVITVDLVPNEPLAMGNYRMVGYVRAGR